MENSLERSMPQARKEGLLIQELADELLVYDLDRKKTHCLNQTAALTWKHCDGRATLAEVRGILEQEMRTPVDEDVIRLALDQLNSRDLLANRMIRSAENGKLSRRVMIRRLGMAAAITLPLITSIIAPTAAQAGSPCRSLPCP